MSGDTSKVSVLANADVLVAPVGSPIPAVGADFDLTVWQAVGLLGEDGLVQARSRDSSDKYALGGILVATTRKNFKQNVTFTVMEENVATDSILWPGSTRTFTGADYTGDLKVPDTGHKFMIAFVVRSGDMEKRVISKNYAQVDDVGDLTENDEDLPTREVTCSVYPTMDGTLFATSKVGANLSSASIDLAPATSTKTLGQTTQLVVTATYADTTTEVVTNQSDFVSSDPTKATVSATGLVTFVAGGTATITATFGGHTDTTAITVKTATSIDMLPATKAGAAGATQQLAVTATYSDASTADVTTATAYVSSAPSKATVNAAGLITLVATGTATITGTYQGQTDTCAVTVS